MLNVCKFINVILYNGKFLLNFSLQNSRSKPKHINNYQDKSVHKFTELKEKDNIRTKDGELVRLQVRSINNCSLSKSSNKCVHSRYEGKYLRLATKYKLMSTGNNVLFQNNRNYKNFQLKCNYCSNLPRKVCHPRGTACPVQTCKPPAVVKTRSNGNLSLTTLRLILLLSIAVTSGTIYYILYKEWERVHIKQEVKKTEGYQTKKGKEMGPKLIFERKPCCSDELPDEVPYLMVGGGTASSSACSAIRQKEPNAKILILTNEPYRPYIKAPLSKIMIYSKDRELAKQFQYIDKFNNLHSLFFENEGYYLNPKELSEAEKGGIACAHGWPVVKVDPIKKEVTLDDGKIIRYKKCLLATGSSPNQLEITKGLPERVLRQISYYGDLYDFQKLEEVIENGADSIAIFGGGVLGCELASALARRGKEAELKITHIIQEECVMDGILPKYVTRWLTKNILAKSKIRFINNSAIFSIDLNKEGKLEIDLSNDRKVVCDHLLVCIGSVANTELARISGLEICKSTRAFVANQELEVLHDLFTAGDCGSFYDSSLDERINVRHHDYAVYTGTLAGENMTGATKPIDHQLIYFSEIGATMDYEVVGYTNVELPTVGVFAVKKQESGEPPSLPEDIDYSRGVIFYLKEDIIVGAVLWNVPNRLPMVRGIIKAKKTYQDLNDVAKLLELHNN